MTPADQFQLAAWIADQDLARQVRARDQRRAERLALSEESWYRSPIKERP